MQSWLPTLSHDLGSFSGVVHIRGVEYQVSTLIEGAGGICLSLAESFVLLCSVLFHDIGKVVDVDQIRSAQVGQATWKDPGWGELPKMPKSGDGKKKKKEKDPEIHHARLSYETIHAKWESLGLPDRGIAHCIAIACAAHEQSLAETLRGAGMLEDCFLDRWGRIRVGWIAALLALGDELDNSYARAVCDWVRHRDDPDSSSEVSTTKGEFRDRLAGCEVDLGGQLLIIHAMGRIESCFEGDESSNRPGDTELKHLSYLYDDLRKKEQLLKLWRGELRQMRIALFGAALCVNGHLLGIKESAGKSHNRHSFKLILEPTIRQIKIDRILEAASHLQFKTFGKTSFPWETLATEAGFEQLGEVRRVFHRLAMLARIYSASEKGASLPTGLRLCTETSPRYSNPRLRLRFSEMDDEWTIAVEAVGDGSGRNEDSAKDTIRLFYDWVSAIASSAPSNAAWGVAKGGPENLMLRIENRDLAYLLDENGREVARSAKRPEVGGGGVDTQVATGRGIMLPQSTSMIFAHRRRHPAGLNLVISGPPGVGKSTLAMDLIARSRPEWLTPFGGGRSTKAGAGNGAGGSGQAEVESWVAADAASVCAYFSLEQPQETVRGLALDVGFSDPQIKSLFVDYGTEAASGCPEYIEEYRRIAAVAVKRKGAATHKPRVDDADGDRWAPEPVLLLSKLAPRSYGDAVDEERLFWFRYRQISRLIEAHRAARDSENVNLQGVDSTRLLSAIVIDNLNAFARHPLARQRVHQLFSLLAWGGVLGIHIVEVSSSGETTTFQNDVEFLADVVIGLDWRYDPYQYKVFEIKKSRCQRNVLGRHPFKIRRDPASGSGWSKSPCFEIYPSVHTQVSRVEKATDVDKDKKGIDDEDTKGIKFAANADLCELVQKNTVREASPKGTKGRSHSRSDSSHQSPGSTGVPNDAFVVLRGQQGGHKLALGMSFVHGKRPDQSAMVINMGQPISYHDVAGYEDWKWHWADGSENFEIFKNTNQKWAGNDKVSVDVYRPHDDLRLEHGKSTPTVYILNFHAGFLLVEEFLHILRAFLDEFSGPDNSSPIRRVLFNATSLLPERFPLLDREPLLLTAMARFFKKNGISLMIIAVEGVEMDNRVASLSAIADLIVSVHHGDDARLSAELRAEFEKKQKEKREKKELASAMRIVSADNVTGKDYKKEFGFLFVDVKRDLVLDLNRKSQNQSEENSSTDRT